MNDDELLARLRAADPAASLPPADPGRTARLLEDTMSQDLDTPVVDQDTPVRRRPPLAWLVAAAAVLVIAGVGAFALLGGDDSSVPSAQEPPASVMTLSAPRPTTAKCMVPNVAVLRQQQVAFDGTVASISDGVVTLEVSRWYLGGDDDRVTVKAPPADLRALILAADFRVGQRYLVSASDGAVTVCGFSAPYSDDLAALYAQAFGS